MMPGLPKGVILSREDYDLVAGSLSALAAEADRKGSFDISGKLKSVAVRLRQAVFAGDGADPEMIKSWSSRIESAFGDGDYLLASKNLQAMLEAVIRMDPDPAKHIAEQIAPQLVKLVIRSSAHGQMVIAAATLRSMLALLSKDRPKDSDSDVFDSVLETIEFTASELEHGLNPFADQDKS